MFGYYASGEGFEGVWFIYKEYNHRQMSEVSDRRDLRVKRAHAGTYTHLYTPTRTYTHLHELTQTYLHLHTLQHRPRIEKENHRHRFKHKHSSFPSASKLYKKIFNIGIFPAKGYAHVNTNL